MYRQRIKSIKHSKLVRKTLLVALSFAFFCTVTAQVCELDPDSEVFGPIWTVKQNLSGYSFSAPVYGSIYFIERDVDEFQPIINIHINLSDLANAFPAIVRSRLASNCESRLADHSYRITLSGNQLISRFAVRYEQWTCASFDYPCFEGLKWYSCRKDISNKWFQATSDVAVTLTATVLSEDEIDITGRTSIDVPSLADKLGPVGGILQDVFLGVFEFITGDDLLEPIKEWANYTMRETLSLQDIPDLASYEFKPYDVYFERWNNESGIKLKIRYYSSHSMRPNLACFVKRNVINKLTNLE